MLATPENRPEGSSSFPPTRWSLIVQANEVTESESETALAELCEIYWQPLFAYARRSGLSREDAEDAVQGFLASFVRKEAFARADRQHGKLRSFLLASLKNYMSTERRSASRQKRGSGQVVAVSDLQENEQRYLDHFSDGQNPETSFDRMWVITLLETVMAALQKECERQGKADLLQRIGPYISSPIADQCPYADLAREYGMSEPGARVMVHRMRSRYRQLLRQKLVDTLERAEDLEVEISYLLGLFSKS